MDGGAADSASTRQIDTKGRSMRQHAARGTVVNGVFLISLSVVSLIRGFVLAKFLTKDDYGIWGLLVVGLGTLGNLKIVGVGDRFIQQDEPDQEAAFQKAFTVEAIFTSIFAVFMVAAVPFFAWIYGRWEIVLPAYVSLLVLPAGVFQAPLWIFYREMNFLKQRILQASEPIVGLVLGVILAVAGAGYWSLVLGALVGAWTTTLFAVYNARFKFRWRYERGALRSYASFSMPLFVAGVSLLLMSEAIVLLPNWRLGLGAAGAITLAGGITQFSDRVDQIITGTMYPAICAAKDRIEVLAESFVKSNRLALMWAMPFGVGVTLFAGDLVHFFLGELWVPAIGPLEIFGVTAAFGHIGFNWDAYMRARANTRPIATTSVVSVVAFFVVGVPLLYTNGLIGLSLGISAHVVAVVACRGYYMGRLFRGFNIGRHMLRAIVPTIPATAVVLGIRLLETGPRTKVEALGEIVAYSLVTIAATAITERPLMVEAIGYMRGRAAPAPAPA